MEVLKFSNAEQFVDFTLSGVAPGVHRIMVKGWDSSGAFSSAGGCDSTLIVG